jgi:DNA-binding LacI/PurR family transcriptional regulator
MNIKVCPKSQWEEILDDLKIRLNNGEYSVGEAFYTIDEICDTFNVSRITAKRVFQELKHEGWILPNRRRGTIVNRSHTTKDILFIVGSDFLEKPAMPESNFFVIDRLLEGLRAKEKLCNVKITTIGHKFFFSQMKEFVNKDVVILAQLLYDFRDWFEKHPEYFECLKSDIRPVLMHAFEKQEGFSLTETNYGKGIRSVVEHLLNKGHKRIAYLTGDINFPSMYLRFNGFTDTLKEHNITLDLNQVKVNSDRERDTSWQLIRQLLSQSVPPTAIACASDMLAMHVIEYCRKNGVRVPENLAVTGFDNRGESGFLNPPLTTVDSKIKEQGEKAVEFIMQRSADKVSEPVTITIEPELILRKST